jgi:hypothetical protein
VLRIRRLRRLRPKPTETHFATALHLRLLGRLGPEGGGASTSQGHPYAIFGRAMARGNVLSALAAARDAALAKLIEWGVSSWSRLHYRWFELDREG